MSRSNQPSPPNAAPLSGCFAPLDSNSPLGLAHAAYQRTGPSQREVDLAVARVQTRLNGRRRRVRVGALMAFAVVFVGALAYAAGALSDRAAGELSLGDTRSAVPAVSPRSAVLAVSQRSGLADASTSREAEDKVEVQISEPAELAGANPRASRAGASVRVPAPAATALSSSVARTAGPPRASAWAIVAESMASKDYARAEGALRELAKSDASDVRNNATLGIAQLALGRGDCGEARRLAQRVLQNAPNREARRRSQGVLARCPASDSD